MERPAFRLSGFLMVGILLLVFAAACVGLGGFDTVRALLFVVAVVLLALSASGFAIVNPNEARVVQFFGRYVGWPTCWSCSAATATSSRW